MPDIVETKTIYEGWGRFLVVHVREGDDLSYSRQVDDHGDASCVLPYDPERRTVVLVRQLRAPLLHRGADACGSKTLASNPHRSGGDLVPKKADDSGIGWDVPFR